MKRYSKQREVVLEILSSTKLHPNATTIYEAAREVIPNISLLGMFILLLYNKKEKITRKIIRNYKK